jgi:hypothetical protein
MNYIVDPGLDFKIREAAELASRFFAVGLLPIKDVKSFTFTNLDPEYVFNLIASSHTHFKVQVVPWKPRWRFTSAIATTFASIPNVIHINVYKVNSRSKEAYVATLVHEALHVMGFNHGSNSGQGREPKLSSVPIKVAAIAKAWAIKYVK